MRQVLQFVLTGLLLSSICFGQQVIPPARVPNMESIPGLTNALGETLTNAIAGGFTGTSSGRIEKIGRQIKIEYPSFESWLTTNSFVSSFVISNTGLTTVKFPYPIFRGNPFVQFMYINLPDDIVLTPILTDLSTNGFTVKFLSSGEVITNGWTIYYLAAESLNFGMYGSPPTAVSNLVDGTNVMLRDGSRAMLGKLVAPGIRLSGDGANKWITGNAQGDMIWELKSIANLTDGANVYRRDGSLPLTGDMNGNLKSLNNLASIQIFNVNGTVNNDPPNDYVLTSATLWGRKGQATWKQMGANVWANYPAINHVNLNNYGIRNMAFASFKNNLSGLWALHAYSHGTFGDVLEFRYTPPGGSSDGWMGVCPRSIFFARPIELLGNSGITNNVRIFDGLYLTGKLKPGVPNNLGNRFSFYSEPPVAIRDGLMVGDDYVLTTYNPPQHSVCAYGGFYGVGKHIIFRNRNELDIVATSPLWNILTNYYPITLSANRVALYNATLMVGSSLEKFDYYKGWTGPDILVERNVEVGNDVNVGRNLWVGGSKSFRITHPKNENKWLIYSSIEGPKADLMHRGKVNLVNGRIVLNIDSYFNLTEGTFEALTTNTDVLVWNNKSWDRVRGIIEGNILTIECENTNFNDEVSFIIFGERKDVKIENEVDK